MRKVSKKLKYVCLLFVLPVFSAWGGCSLLFDAGSDDPIGREICIPTDDCNETLCVENCDACTLAGQTYYFCHPEKQTWTDAETECKSISAELVSFNSAEELEAIVSFAHGLRRDSGPADVSNQVCGSVQRQWWIGLNDMEKNGLFLWSDGTTLAGSEFDPKWASGQPNNTNGEEYCVQMGIPREDDVSDADYMPTACWNDRDCDNSTAWFICEG